MALAGDDGSWLQRAAARTQNLFSRRALDGVSRLVGSRLASGPMGRDHLFRFIDMRGLEIVMDGFEKNIHSSSICCFLNHLFWAIGKWIVFVFCHPFP